MSWTPIVNGGNESSGSGTTIAVTVAGVHVGDAVAATVGGFNAAGAPTITVSDGTAGLTALTAGGSAGTKLQGFYTLSSPVSGSVTYTATFGTASLERSIIVSVWTPSNTPTLDTQSAPNEVIATAAGISGSFSTTGTDDLVIAYEINENASASSVEQINAVNADGVFKTTANANKQSQWYRLLSTTLFGATATETIGLSTRIWTGVVAFKIAGGSSSISASASRSVSQSMSASASSSVSSSASPSISQLVLMERIVFDYVD